MATLHLMIGLPCSGKTTLAKQLEIERDAVRLTSDEWVTRLYGPEVTGATEATHDLVESMLWDIALRVLRLGVNVVLDFGCWAREEREYFRAGAADVGARTELHYLDVPEDVLLARVRARNAESPAGSFRIDPELVSHWSKTIFQPPTDDELRPREAPE